MASGEQVNEFTLNGLDLTDELNALLEARGGSNNEYNIYRLQLPSAALGTIASGIATFFLRMQGPSLGDLGGEFLSNGAGLDFARLDFGDSDIIPTGLTWNLTQSGVDVEYEVTGQPRGAKVLLHWSRGPTYAERIGGPVFNFVPEAEEGPHELLASATRMPDPPADARYLLMATKDKANAPIDDDDVLAVELPIVLEPLAQSEFRITGDPEPQMPEIMAELRLNGVDPSAIAAVDFEWRADLKFNARAVPHGPRRRIDVRFAPELVVGELEHRPSFRDEQGAALIRGGELTLSVATFLAGFVFRFTSETVSIRADNPSEDAVRAYVLEQATARGITDHAEDLGRIARQESSYRQFVDGLPLFSADNLGGVGFYQITNPRPTDEEIWDWRANVRAGVRVFSQKVTIASNYPTLLSMAKKFRAAVNALNAARRRDGLPNLTVTIPAFTIEQLRLDAIRGFNGYAGKFMGLRLHEYRLGQGDNGLLLVSIQDGTNQATATWEQVPGDDRPQGVGDPDYVENVLGRAP
jgi:hypothetical protein